MNKNIKGIIGFILSSILGLNIAASAADFSGVQSNQTTSYSLRQKINQMFIVGYKGKNPARRKILSNLLKDGLGGVIFYTYNIKSEEQFKDSVNQIMNISLISPFLSIDQEGGRVERTKNIHKGSKYQNAAVAASRGEDFVKKQTEELCEELKSYGINMNFAPVLDTNTNPDNPIIGIRSYGDTPNKVIQFADIVRKIHEKYGIISVGKHFPGHGDTKVDSHIEMPIVDIEETTFENTHLKPFSYEINNGIPAIMVSHVYYKCYDNKPVPASLSENIVNKLLKEKLKFKGLIISDDMVMGAVKDLDIKDTYIKAIKSGINVFIYKNSDRKLSKILLIIEEEAIKDKELEDKINESFNLILDIKQKYAIIK